MFFTLAGRALVGSLRGLEGPLQKLRTATSIWAGEKRGDKKVAVNLTLFVTEERFEKIIQSCPELVEACNEARAMQEGGFIPTCPTCGAGCAH